LLDSSGDGDFFKRRSDIKTAYQPGATSYVVKPVDFDAFMGAMSSLGLYGLLVSQTLGV
jgi:two-component system, response regulator